ncbi:MAG: hypothetical protein K8S98_01940 [Planctomycetes bacterium]|nr:hypothetical protein [Planctomycetota bacterium]
MPTRVTASAAGYGSVHRAVDARGSSVVLELDRAVHLRGELMTSSGESLAFSRVVAMTSSFVDVVATTDASGRFELPEINLENDVAVVGAKGVATTVERKFALAPGEELDLGDLEWPQKGSIRGRVVDARGAPRIGTVVSAHRGSVVEDPIGATYNFTRENGEFELRGLDDVDYELMLESSFDAQSILHLIAGVVRPGEGSEEFVYDFRGGISGRAIAEDGTPLARADIRLIKGTLSDESVYTDLDGRFEMRFPYRGEVELCVVPYDVENRNWRWSERFDAGRFTIGDERELVLRRR